MDFKFLVPVEIHFGKDKIEQLNELIKGEKVLMVSDPTLKKIGIVDKIKDVLDDRFEIYDFCEVEPNPSCETVDRGAAIAREKDVDAIIGIGGGSSLDSAKAIACLKTSGGRLIEFLNNKKQFAERRPLLISIPTTSGTGSEVTNVGVYTDKENGRKKPLVTDHYWSDYAIIDPALTLTLPPRPTATTGLDAFTHAIEAYWADTTQPMSQLLSLEAMKLIVGNLERAILKQNDEEARENLMLASLMAGISFAQTRTTVLHALSFPLTNRYGLEHGFACAIAMPEVIRANYENSSDEMDRLLNYLSFEDVDSFADYMHEMMGNIDAPTKLSEIGIKEKDLDEIAEITLSAPIAELNPKKFNKEELKSLLKKIL